MRALYSLLNLRGAHSGWRRLHFLAGNLAGGLGRASRLRSRGLGPKKGAGLAAGCEGC